MNPEKYMLVVSIILAVMALIAHTLGFHSTDWRIFGFALNGFQALVLIAWRIA